MHEKILIPQSLITFKESDKKIWHEELKKENPFETDCNIIPPIIPFYNRCKTISKAVERPERYFRECCVIKAFSAKYEKGYYTHSIHLFYSRKWLKGIPPTELFQKELFDDLHNHRYFPPERLTAAQERISKSDYLIRENLNPKLPDVWLVKDYPHSIFIEVKRLRENFVAGQKEGLAIIKKYLGCDIRIARVCSENENLQGLEFEDIDITDIYHKI
jgi:hypothetical protein